MGVKVAFKIYINQNPDLVKDSNIAKEIPMIKEVSENITENLEK